MDALLSCCVKKKNLASYNYICGKSIKSIVICSILIVRVWPGIYSASFKVRKKEMILNYLTMGGGGGGR